LYETNEIKYPSEKEIYSVASIDEATGVFTISNSSEAMKWQVWISATGPDGMKSGLSTIFNMKIHLFNPPSNEKAILAPKFMFTENSGKLS
jgi:hypothetical protein